MMVARNGEAGQGSAWLGEVWNRKAVVDGRGPAWQGRDRYGLETQGSAGNRKAVAARPREAW